MINTFLKKVIKKRLNKKTPKRGLNNLRKYSSGMRGGRKKKPRESGAYLLTSGLLKELEQL
jgi:hypothetical protein